MNIAIKNMDDLHWQATHQINDITISIVQGNGCQGSRSSDTYEVLVWDSDGNIPLSDLDIGSYMAEGEVITLIRAISNWNHAKKSWAEYQRQYFPNALCNTITDNFQSNG
ncbi:MAG: hypothetical protein P8P37_01660 [Candidatus Marinimicrobia bacterium]|nr:hypothetical protein [Candidatus Neomarinimicrobiota bacterium]